MSRYRHSLPQTRGHLFITDGGLETTLVFHEKMELPAFAAFPLLLENAGRGKLSDYYRRYLVLAEEHGLGFILESATWRANPDWATHLGYSRAQLAEINRASISELVRLRMEFERRISHIVISGCLGPRGDGYVPGNLMTSEQAEEYHSEQIRIFSETEADMVTAFTLNYVEEAIGITRAAHRHRMPVAVSFTLETDGRLPNGQTLKDAIEQVDAAADRGPLYYMINCAHPVHFAGAIESDEPWVQRIRGIRANASRRSHAELNESPTLDEGKPAELGAELGELRVRRPRLTILGGCCGTDERHVAAICAACAEPALA
jgi:S-methylmethionine-dependent homocysteine/selenocysteine methylase